MSEALGLHDMASQIARARFRLRALQPHSIPSVSTLCEHIDALADIATAATQQLKKRSSGAASHDQRTALLAYSYALDPLGECITELGRANTAVLDFHFEAIDLRTTRDPGTKPDAGKDDLELARRRAAERISAGCEVVDSCLGTLARDLQRTAMKLAPPVYVAPPLKPGALQDRPGLASTVPAALSVAASRTTKGR
ncbi:hypothetical protein [Streptomyces sp. NPDC091040]|uniref:hypothetical protein n=1 Tax=Streptomyces sp. NPDC091040 TaxID=3365972 RepID=UPI0037FD0B97